VAPAATDLLIGCGKRVIIILAGRMFARSVALKPGAARHRLRQLGLDRVGPAEPLAVIGSMLWTAGEAGISGDKNGACMSDRD
jgi:hypothetical protein